MKLPLPLLFLCCIANVALPADIFVAQTTQGGDTGNDAANAHSLSWATNNWPGGDNNVRLCGTFTSELPIPGGGTAGHPLTITFESGAKFSAGTWPSLSKIISGGSSYIIIDGGVNGTIEATNQGSGLGFTNNFKGLVFSGTLTNVEIKNLIVNGLFVKLANSVDCDSFSNSIDAINISGQLVNCSIHNCHITNTANCIVWQPQAGYTTNSQCYSNDCLNASWGIFFESGQPGSLYDQTWIWGNYIRNGTNWDGCPGSFHQDGIIAGCSSLTTTNLHMHIRRNNVGGNMGVSSTAPIFVEQTQYTNQNQGLVIDDNVIVDPTGHIYNNGSIAVNADFPLIANNTLYTSVGGTALAIDCSVGVTNLDGTYQASRGGRLYNNVSYGISFGVILSRGFVSDAQRNIYYFAGNPVLFGSNFSNRQITWDTWTNGFSVDITSTTNQPSLDPITFIPLPGDTLTLGGTNLTALGITDDFNGNPRPATGDWDKGAFNRSASGNATVGSLNVGTVWIQ